MALPGEYMWHDVVRDDFYYLAPEAGAIVNDPSRVLLTEQSSDVYFYKSSVMHGRSFEDPNQYILRSGTPLADEFGNYYPHYSVKGAEAVKPTVTLYDIEPSGVRVNGMLDAATFPRCLRISQILRAGGALTEWPIFHARPKTFPDGETSVGLQAFRKMLYESYVERNQAVKDPNNTSYTYLAASVGQVGVVGAALSEIQFGVMYRAMLSNARVSELKLGLHTARLYTGVAIEALKQRRPEHFAAWLDIEAIKDPFSQTEQANYLDKILPSIMGENLARIHNTGSYHKYPHAGNWTQAGELVDNDSVRNAAFEPEDAEEITVEARMHDATTSIATLSQYPVILPDGVKDMGTDKLKLVANAAFQTRERKFYRSYLDMRKADPTFTLAEELILVGTWGLDDHEELTKTPVVCHADAYFDDVVTEVCRQLRLLNELGDEERAQLEANNAMSECASILLPIFTSQVVEYLEQQGIDASSPWIRPDRVAKLELSRYVWEKQLSLRPKN